MFRFVSGFCSLFIFWTGRRHVLRRLVKLISRFAWRGAWSLKEKLIASFAESCASYVGQMPVIIFSLLNEQTKRSISVRFKSDFSEN